MLRSERVTEPEIFAAIRAHGESDRSAVAAVVLETDSSCSVIANAPDGPFGTLRHVETPAGR